MFDFTEKELRVFVHLQAICLVAAMGFLAFSKAWLEQSMMAHWLDGIVVGVFFVCVLTHLYSACVKTTSNTLLTRLSITYLVLNVLMFTLVM